MKTLLHVGCGAKRKDRTTAEQFDAWVRPKQMVVKVVMPDLIRHP